MTLHWCAGPTYPFAFMRNNWGITTNAGMMVAALGFYEYNTTAASSLLRYATAGFAYTLQAYGPDGAWPEGKTHLLKKHNISID